MQMIKYNKIIKLLLLSLIVCLNLNWCLLSLPVPQFPVKIENDIVESSNQLKGRIGFCCIFSYFGIEGIESKWQFFKLETYAYIPYKYLNELQNLFLDIIGNRELVDCNYEKLNDFNYRKSRPRDPNPFTVHHFWQPNSYIKIFDDKNKDEWMMYKDVLRFLNEFFNCDYYLTGKVYMSYEKKSGYEHNLLLVIYNNKGYKVWSKRYRNKYSFDDVDEWPRDRDKIAEKYYENIKSLLNDYKEEINKDLDLIIGNRKD